MPPTDPLLYRFYELVMVNGPALEGADRGGIRRRHHVGDRLRPRDSSGSRNPKGDRVRLAMSGKFLPYKYYGAEQGILEYGVKEP